MQGKWLGSHAGIGAGSDSFYEYLLKSYILLGEPSYLHMFNKVRWVGRCVAEWEIILMTGCPVFGCDSRTKPSTDT
jgi:hypothetical protein